MVLEEIDVFVEAKLELLLSEADRLAIIDHEWYKDYLKNRLESIGFKHFVERQVHINKEELSDDAGTEKEKEN